MLLVTLRSSVLLAWLVLFLPHGAHAMCNVIPGAVSSQRGELGAVDRPFASPGDFVSVEVSPAECDAESAGLGSDADEHVVSLLLTPPNGTASSVAIASDCGSLDLGSCSTQLCFDADTVGPNPDLLIRTNPLGRREIFFRVPETGFAGPATIVVTNVSDPVPCSQPTSPCSNANYPNAIACIDDLHHFNGDCDSDINAFFPHFTLLPPPNDFGAVCSTADTVCGDSTQQIVATTDEAGNLLVPWNYRGVLAEKDGVPVARIGVGHAQVDRFPGVSSEPLQIPPKGFLSSHAPEGLILPPIFTPLAGTVDDGGVDSVALFGSIDAAQGVMRVARRSAEFSECVHSVDGRSGIPCTLQSGCAEPGYACSPAVCYMGQVATATTCSSDDECAPNEQCGPSLFDFSGRYSDAGGGTDNGPLILQEGESNPPDGVLGGFSSVDLREAVPIEGLIESDQLFAFVVNEAVDGVDVNGDGGTDDFVVTLTDRQTGTEIPIGNSALGRAVARAPRPPFSVSAVAVEDDFLAFLESEAKEGAADSNGDGDVLDYHVRAYKLGDDDELLDDLYLVANPNTRVGVEPLTISDGRLFITVNELHETGAAFTNLSAIEMEAVDSANPSLSGDGRYVAYDSNGLIKVVDRSSLAVVTTITGTQPSLSYTGRFVAYTNSDHVHLFDRDEVTTTLVSTKVGDTTSATRLNCSGEDYGASQPVLSQSADDTNVNPMTDLPEDGRHVMYFSYHTDLVAGDGNDGCDSGIPLGADFFAWDRDTGITTRLSIHANDDEVPDGVGNVEHRSNRAISRNGRHAAFESEASLHDDDMNGVRDIYYRNIVGGSTQWVTKRDDDSDVLLTDMASRDGVYVLFTGRSQEFHSLSNGATQHVFVWDRSGGVDGRIDMVSKFRAVPGNDDSFNGTLQFDGRTVQFKSLADNLVSDDESGTLDWFHRDRLASFGGQIPNGGNGDFIRFASFPESAPLADPNSDPLDFFPLNAGTARGVAAAFVADVDVADGGDGNPTGMDDIYLTELSPESNPNVDDSDPLSPDDDYQGTDWLIRVIDLESASVEATLKGSFPMAVHNGSVAYLRIEADSETNFGSSDPNLNPDEVDLDLDQMGNQQLDDDNLDAVVQLWPPPAGADLSEPDLGTTNLGITGQYVGLSDELVATVDVRDEVQIFDLNVTCSPTPPATSILECWHALDAEAGGDGSTARGLQVRDSAVAFRRSEPREADLCGHLQYPGGEPMSGNADLNGDGDTTDLLMALYEHGAGAPGTLTLIEDDAGVPQPVRDFVLGDEILAFSTPEAALCFNPANQIDCDGVFNVTCTNSPDCDLNGDGDCEDDVLQVWHRVNQELINTGSAVTPCTLEACDPTVPFRVDGTTVRFLTSEVDQGGQDLNNDGDGFGVVVQLFNTIGADPEDRTSVFSGSEGSTGITAAQHPMGQNDEQSGIPDPAEVQLPGTCTEAFEETCAIDDDCPSEEFCNGDFLCARSRGTCESDSDCDPPAFCDPTFSAAASADRDGDRIPDARDNCPDVENATQLDSDGDGFGEPDAGSLGCDSSICGNDVVEAGEFADCEFDRDAGETLPWQCTPACRVGGCFGDINLDGSIDAIDRDLFFTDPGCFPCTGNCTNTCDWNGNDRVNAIDALFLVPLTYLPVPLKCPKPSPAHDPWVWGSCGLGWEIAPVLVGLSALRRRKRAGRRQRSS
jgi:hypothetical protein